MDRKNKYIVFKTEDIFNALDSEQFEQLENICRVIKSYRDDAGKERIGCVVFENGRYGCAKQPFSGH